MNITKITIPVTNYDTTRKPITAIVIHWIVGNLAAADAVFKKQGGGTSAHYAVEDDIIHQYVDESHTAYAVGVYSKNQETISIEHSADQTRPASNRTYETSGRLIAEIAKRHNIPLNRAHILKHSEIKATQCPGTMDVDRLISIARQIFLPEPNPGYAPSFEGQTVEKDGKIYESYRKDGQLLWKVRGSVNWEQKYKEEVLLHEKTKNKLTAYKLAIQSAKKLFEFLD